MIGLTSGKATTTWNTNDYAIYLQQNNYIYIYEKNKQVGHYGRFARGNTFSISINEHGFVEFKLEGKVFYVSKQLPRYPLHVMANLYTAKVKITDFKWLSLSKKPEKKFAVGKYVDITRLDRISEGENPGEFEKKADAGNAWNQGSMHSEQKIDEKSKVRGISWQPRRTNCYMIVGLNSKHHSKEWLHRHYVCFLHEPKATLYVYEKGRNVANLGAYNTNDILSIAVNDKNKEVEYQINGFTFWTSKMNVRYPLYVAGDFYSQGSNIKDLKWIGSSKLNMEVKANQYVQWSVNRFVGAFNNEGSLIKRSNGNGWNAGTYSRLGIKKKQKKAFVEYPVSLCLTIKAS